MKKTSYDRPPITEAVIGVNFSMPIGSKDIEKANGKFLKNYPQHQVIQNLNLKVEVAADGQTNTNGTEVERGHRRSNADSNELLVMWSSTLLVSQLAPYLGWDVFFARFSRDWNVWKRAVGFREVSRIGVRFINRIDIPIKDGSVKHEEYLNVYPKLPSIIESVDAYAVQALVPLADIQCTLTLNSGVIPAPVLGHSSFLLDLDIAKSVNPPQNDNDIFDLLNLIRKKKNDVFESCISDDARGLF